MQVMAPAVAAGHALAVSDHPGIDIEIVPAEPVLLHRPPLLRTDANSPLLRRDGRTLAFVSHYLPLGHTLRHAEAAASWPDGPVEPVRLLDDATPQVGKWIESVWRASDGRLFGWYHAEEPHCLPRLFLPHIGALVSDDEGRSWRLLGELMRAPPGGFDCAYQNGFLAGGYGDFCVVPDRKPEWFYLHYSCYAPDERKQGVCVLRYPVAARERPAGLEIWRDGGWQPRKRQDDATPVFAVTRGWRHRDPAAYWGPAIHYNRDLGLYIMLLNWTEGGNADIVQRGVFVSFNADLGNPAGWSAPRRIVEGGSWYPQAIGLGANDSDTLAGAEARFFLSGFSAWTIRFRHGTGKQPALPVPISRETFVELFGFAPW